MWLIDTTTLRLEYFVDSNSVYPTRYAILSHTWAEDEVSFQDFQDVGSASKMKGFSKIAMTCKLARERGLGYAWVDTCCIDKTNNVELTEAINSMFRWYKESEVCFVYLSDFGHVALATEEQVVASLRHCRWFGRGWTLQELIAPKVVEFLDCEWSYIHSKQSFAVEISRLTGINVSVLSDSRTLKTVTAARKMSWAASRETTRMEDMAYCLLGIFDINMPMIYGEGHRAFHRLQEEIVRETNDLSIFAWTTKQSENAGEQEYEGVFAPSPVEFIDCSAIEFMKLTDRFDQEFAITNKGLRIESVLAIKSNTFVLNLQCYDARFQSTGSVEWIGIYLTKTPRGFVRSRTTELYFPDRTEWHFGKPTRVYVPKYLSPYESQLINNQYHDAIGIAIDESQLFKVVDAKPETLWDDSKGVFLIGEAGRFTGYLKLQSVVPDWPRFEFIIICGRAHLPMQGHQHSRESCRFESWCTVFTEANSDWEPILACIRSAGDIADVPSLDYVYQYLIASSILKHNSCEFNRPSEDLQVKVSVSLKNKAPGDLNPSLSAIKGDAQSIEVGFIRRSFYSY